VAPIGRQLQRKGNPMSLKLKALGLGLVAAMAMGAFAVVNASAFTGGHFTSQATEHHLIVKGEETFPGNHNLTFQRTVDGAASGEPIKCTRAVYHGTLSGTDATTTQSVSVTPKYEECSTGGVAPHNVTVHHLSSCGTNIYQFTSGNPGTIHVRCPVTVTHPNCTIRMPEQTVSGATYNTTVESNKHALTVNIEVPAITGHFESGFCVFLGTTQNFHMKGSVTVWAENTAGGRVGITHSAP
jgi:hypothetical protein